jgi:hypothetical protein
VFPLDQTHWLHDIASMAFGVRTRCQCLSDIVGYLKQSIV